MSKLPWLKFDLDDWNNDPELQQCSLDSQAVLIKLMGLMSRALPVGYLKINGSFPSVSSLSRAVKVHPTTLKKCLKELQDNGVLKSDGLNWYSQRMRSDWEKYEKSRDAGKLGGNPALVNLNENKGLTQPLKQNKNKNKNKNKKEYTKEFLTFWENYPRKAEKAGALKAWNICLKTHKPEHLILAASRYAEDCFAQATELKFVKLAATFLGPKQPFDDYLDEDDLDPEGRVARLKKEIAEMENSKATVIAGRESGEMEQHEIDHANDITRTIRNAKRELKKLNAQDDED